MRARETQKIKCVRARVCVCMCVCACVHTHTHTHARARAHAHIHTHTHTHTHTRTRTHPHPPSWQTFNTTTPNMCSRAKNTRSHGFTNSSNEAEETFIKKHPRQNQSTSTEHRFCSHQPLRAWALQSRLEGRLEPPPLPHGRQQGLQTSSHHLG